MKPTRLLNFSHKLREKSLMVKKVKFCDRLSQNLAETKNGYNLQPNSTSHRSSNFCDSLSQKFPGAKTLLILNKFSDPAARLYYLRATARFGWCRAMSSSTRSRPARMSGR